MSKKKVDKHPVVHEVNPVGKTTKPASQQSREQKQKDQGEVVVKWVFGTLVVLAILYVIWTMYIVR